jgi:hypothetical protein
MLFKYLSTYEIFSYKNARASGNTTIMKDLTKKAASRAAK